MSPSFLRRERRPLSRATARNAALINQLATPGLGSLLAGRWLAGVGQLLLALAGFGLILAWFARLMIRLYQQIEANSSTDLPSIAWMGEAGAAVFAAAWLWALFTSSSILREGAGGQTSQTSQTGQTRDSG